MILWSFTDKFTTFTISSGGNTSKNSKDMATVLQERLAPSGDAGTVGMLSLSSLCLCLYVCCFVCLYTLIIH
jgi:ABC-type transport system substrate-binding protein